MIKILTKKNGEMHFGGEAPDEFKNATKEDVKKIISDLGDRKLWRCTICNDLHIGPTPPKICPTCKSIEAYVEIDEKEFMNIVNI